MSRPGTTTGLFRGDLLASFVDRPNRYLVRALVAGGVVEAYCPNPGRLAELLLPGVGLLLDRAAPDGGRRTRYTLVAVHHPRTGLVVPLYASRSNTLARSLVIPRLFPDALEVRPESRLGSSRIDFAVGLPRGRRAYVEVKTCTLVEHGAAMFPDAPTARGLRHLEELASIPREARAKGHALFVLMSPRAERMVPNVHTDPDFAFGLLRLAPRLHLHAVAVRCSASGRARLERAEVPVDLAPIRRFAAAGYSVSSLGGAYLLVLVLRKPRAIGVGGLGRLDFPAGGYVYVGSAMRGLGSRIARHLRSRKRVHWHIDHLTPVADALEAFPIVSSRRLECDLARDVDAVASGRVPGFGCSDCDCDSHLFRFPDDPRRIPAFAELVTRYRHLVALEG